MGMYDVPLRDTFDIHSRNKGTKNIWDPIETLNIINPDRNALTCVGYAPSCRRRCRNPINAFNRAAAFKILDELCCLDTQSTQLGPQLRKLASLTLCVRYHQDQADNMANQWERKISAIKPTMKIKVEDAEETPAGIWIDLSNGADRFEEIVSRIREQLERARRIKEETAESQRIWQGKTEREETRQRGEDEGKRKEEAQKEKVEKERAKREKEQKEKAQKEKEEKARREQQREIEENERRRKQNEAREWNLSWDTYVTKWNEFEDMKTKNTDGSLRQHIPWPVKSGKAVDITDAAVSEFYRRGPPPTNSANENFKLMAQELLKWHDDKIPKLCGGAEADENIKNLCNISARAALRMRKELGLSKNEGKRS